MDFAGTEYTQWRCSQKMDDAGTAISKEQAATGFNLPLYELRT
jgi:hypothetical protein